jgi:hypothetical protein
MYSKVSSKDQKFENQSKLLTKNINQNDRILDDGCDDEEISTLKCRVRRKEFDRLKKNKKFLLLLNDFQHLLQSLNSF